MMGLHVYLQYNYCREGGGGEGLHVQPLSKSYFE